MCTVGDLPGNPKRSFPRRQSGAPVYEHHRRLLRIGAVTDDRLDAGRFLAANPNVQPIRLKAGCLGGGLPAATCEVALVFRTR